MLHIRNMKPRGYYSARLFSQWISFGHFRYNNLNDTHYSQPWSTLPAQGIIPRRIPYSGFELLWVRKDEVVSKSKRHGGYDYRFLVTVSVL